MHRKHGSVLVLSSLGVAFAALLIDTPTAHACGCLSPPAVSEGEFAVNQRAEQIIFEVEPGWVTAHVLIKYAGDPAKFAWIVPVPEVPELAISPISSFGLLDKITAPVINVQSEDICPISEYDCVHPPQESCGDLSSAGDDSPGALDAGAFGDGGSGSPVDVINEQIVGDYQTVTFRASEAQAATQWLRDNGFVVNQTTSIYMESYVQANMVFVAAKLVPGAGAKSIKPLRLKYRAAYPQVPLVLTAVAAEPHLTVTSFIYASKAFKPQGHPIVQINADRIARDGSGRTNYPMVLARTVDEAGGDGFVVEFAGSTPVPQFGGQSSFCCDSGSDSCFIGNDNQCQCPRAGFDAEDCGKTGDIIEGVKLLDDLAKKYPTVTRITTRISAEEMTFDPAFEADFANTSSTRLTINAKQPSLTNCGSAVIDKPKLAEIQAQQSCSTLYCGAGECMSTPSGAGCQCNAGFVAQRFIDLDGLPSVTCVPQNAPCDLRAGGDPLPDACANVSCGAGICQDRNGVAVCLCNANAAAVATIGDTPKCALVDGASGTPGAEDFSEPLRELDVCAPPPPACSGDGYLVKKPSARPGVDCGGTKPNVNDMIPKLGKSCGAFGCGGCSTDGTAPVSGIIGGAWILLALVFRRRRRA